MSPLAGLRFFLPAIVPSWRFFDVVTASPRVDYAVLAAPDAPADGWREFRPRPAVLTVGSMVRRLLWNAPWNESLFLVSLAERMLTAASPETVLHSQRELLLRVARHLERQGGCDPRAYLQLRLRLIGRAGPGEPVTSEIVGFSSACLMAELV